MKSLNELLSLKNPTLGQLRETAALLQVDLDSASRTLVELGKEDRGQALNRLRGSDAGVEERAAALDKAVRDRADLSHVLADVQTKIAAEEARLAAEAEADAWQKTWENLARRRRAMYEVEKLSTKIADLFDEMKGAYQDAIASAPSEPEERAIVTPGHYDKDVAKAIVLGLNQRLGYPLVVGELDALERILRINGLPAYLNASEDRLMRAPVLNRDEACGI